MIERLDDTQESHDAATESDVFGQELRPWDRRDTDHRCGETGYRSS
jgi:hypothetical protein